MEPKRPGWPLRLTTRSPNDRGGVAIPRRKRTDGPAARPSRRIAKNMRGEKPMIRHSKLSLGVLAVLAMVLGPTATLRPAAAQGALLCSDHSLPVTLAPNTTDTFHVIGTLCSQGPAAGKTVQLLLHGSTYARYYWDFPYQSVHYSYVQAATRRGYATFNLDRIGNGASDRPPGNSVDIDANGFVVHQVVAALRAGAVAS